jgi:hypothetical protein
VKAAAEVAAGIGATVPIAAIAAKALSWIGSAIPKNQDDALGAFGLKLGNDNGKIVVRELHPGDYTQVVHPVDPQTGAFTVRFRHDDGDYTASLRVYGV